MNREAVARKRQAHNTGVLLSEKGERLVLAVRIRGVNGVPPKAKKTLELLRLLQVVVDVSLDCRLITVYLFV